MILLVLVLIIVGVVTVFSVQNAAPVIVSFIAWQFSASLAVVVFISVVCGMCIMALIFGSMRVRKSVARRGAKDRKDTVATPSPGRGTPDQPKDPAQE